MSAKPSEATRAVLDALAALMLIVALVAEFTGLTTSAFMALCSCVAFLRAREG